VKYAIGIVAAFATLWLILVVALIAARPKELRTGDAARMMPDIVVLVAGLARDRSIPRRVRARIWILLAWMASPIDAIPDVIPVIGTADDVILIYLVLRSVARIAGNDVLEHHWHGSPEGLATLEHLLRLDHNDRTRSRRTYPTRRTHSRDGDP
jgi:uncharacterized membrane protein YkvA (DUF1232 family)